VASAASRPPSVSGRSAARGLRRYVFRVVAPCSRPSACSGAFPSRPAHEHVISGHRFGRCGRNRAAAGQLLYPGTGARSRVDVSARGIRLFPAGSAFRWRAAAELWNFRASRAHSGGDHVARRPLAVRTFSRVGDYDGGPMPAPLTVRAVGVASRLVPEADGRHRVDVSPRAPRGALSRGAWSRERQRPHSAGPAKAPPSSPEGDRRDGGHLTLTRRAGRPVRDAVRTGEAARPRPDPSVGTRSCRSHGGRAARGARSRTCARRTRPHGRSYCWFPRPRAPGGAARRRGVARPRPRRAGVCATGSTLVEFGLHRASLRALTCARWAPARVGRRSRPARPCR